MGRLQSGSTRRRFLKTSAALACEAAVPYTFAARGEDTAKAKNDRLRIGAIGMRYQGTVIAKKALEYGDVVAICDADRQVAEKARADFGDKADLYEDYRKLLDRSDIDVVTIGTPDHWHTKMVLDACRASKDIYCEKPLTLTIDEGKLLCRVVAQTGRIVQVGTWQRSDWRFRLACELVRAGRIGKLRRVTCVLGKNAKGGPFQPGAAPSHLNWDLWQGQTPEVPYIPERCHYTFRWWYEYSGGQMTDWGAHHLDIVHWGMGVQHSGPVEIDGRAAFPGIPNGYNVAGSFSADLTYAGGIELQIRDEGRNGILFEGDAGRIFVNRENLAGRPVDDLRGDPLPPEKFRLYSHDNPTRPLRAGKLDAIINHMGNFYDCLKSRRSPISDVVSQHRSASVCHLANISMRLGRRLKWDPDKERFLGDDEANRWLRREPRKGYQIES
jgi:myo-inositol 2-dehydrogenase / D-chiro-inositol 1-dehydrogenase